MKRLIALSLLVPATVFALDYEDTHLQYTDDPEDRPTRIAVSVLTELGIVKGNPDGTFKPNTPLNRAEFMRIAMGLLPREVVRISPRCFPDVDPNIWFAFDVCRAKSLNIVSGNEIPGLPRDQWPFEPARSVKYEEAIKILTGIYGLPLVQGTADVWYEKYVQTAYKEKIHLEDSTPGSAITRGQMSRLVVAFMAHSKGELEDLRYAETHEPIPVRTVFEVPVSSAPSISSVSSESSASSASSREYDPLIYDTSTDDAVLVLGQVTHILGAAELFANDEPIIVDKFMIDIVAANNSLDSMKVYDHDGVFLGRATIDSSVAGNTRYTLRVKNKNIVLPHRDDFSFYVRGVMRSQDSGGVSGGTIQVDKMGIDGIGKWSSRSYEQFTDGETFAQTTVARSAITKIENAGYKDSVLTPGTGVEIGAFRFEGVTGHSSAKLQLITIDFTASQVGGASFTNPSLKADGSSDTHGCTLAGSTVTCTSLPDSFSRLDDGPRVIRVFGDVAIASGSQGGSIQVSINDPGTSTTAGDVTWTDGVSTFTFVDFGRAPLARGTYYSY